MGDKTGIQWTDATWNPVVGCSVVSPGCTNCYAMKQAARIERMAYGAGKRTHYEGTTKPSKAGAVWTGLVRPAGDDTVMLPLRWKRPRRIFVNSMGDLFHDLVPDWDIDRVFAVMALAPQHTFQVLTKRSKRMRGYLSMARAHPVGLQALGLTLENLEKIPNIGAGCILQGDIAHLKNWPLPNVHLGVSAEDQTRADERIPDLLATPAAVRFVSAEPLLSGIDFTWIEEPDEERDGVIDAILGCNWIDGQGRGVAYKPYRPGHEDRKMTREVVSIGPKIDWVIAGGESGKGARPMHPAWARSIRDQCKAAGVPFFFKQWGEWFPFGQDGFTAWAAHGSSVTRKDRKWMGTASFNDGAGGPNTKIVGPVETILAYGNTGDAGKICIRVGKKAAGRLLDGVEHNGMPA